MATVKTKYTNTPFVHQNYKTTVTGKRILHSPKQDPGTGPCFALRDALDPLIHGCLGCIAPYETLILR